MVLDNLRNTASFNSTPSDKVACSQALDVTPDNTTQFCFPMFKAALEFYRLPINYIRTFKRHPMLDKETQLPIIGKDGKQKMTLQSCNAVQACVKENAAVWTQVNEPFEGSAIWTSEDGKFSYPKKAKNSEIQFIRNIVLDAEYPPAPSIAHVIAQELMLYLVKRELVEPDHPIEDSGAGFHIGLPIVPIEIPADSTPETATLWNAAVASIVKLFIKPEFDRLCQRAGVAMDLEGFDISRILSLPGTWRPHNPDKADCPFLLQGYLRRWLAPYTDGNYPVRQENLKLTELIQDAFEQLQHEMQTAIKCGKDHLTSHPHVSPNDLSNDGLIQTAMNGAKFTALWYGDTSGHDGDWSDADLALCNSLAFWTGKDPVRMDQLFRQSGLMRDKWDRDARSGEKYGEGTIRIAIAGCDNVYDPMYYQHKQYTELDNFMEKTYKRQNMIEENSADREQAEENVQKVAIAKGDGDQRAKDTSSLEKLQLEIYTAIEQENIEALYTLTAGIALLPIKERTLLTSSIRKRTSNLKSDCIFSWSAFKQMIEREVKAKRAYESVKFRENITLYEKTSYGMVRHTEKGNTVLISNFTAEIVADRVSDDGAERTRSYAIRAELLDRSYHFEVPAEDFAECKWVDTYVGARACITVGSSMKWHLISSIKYCSDPQEQFYYAHTGWRKIDGLMGEYREFT